MTIDSKEHVLTDILQIQKELLKMLEAFVSVCDKNQITYFMAGGSLLGTIRHNGFIPWDDDIDLLLPRDSYEKLIKIWPQYELPYELQSISNTTNYGYPYAKLVNKDIFVKEKLLQAPSFLWIDIFPLDGLPNNIILRNFHLCAVNVLKYLRWQSASDILVYKNAWKSNMKKILFFPFLRLGNRRISAAINWLAKKYSLQGSRKVACIVGKYNRKECVAQQVFSKVRTAKFENLTVTIPEKYDTYLKSLYGDYMKIPEEADRERHIEEKNTYV